MPLSIVILAAGQGTRMQSTRPKVLHSLAGKSLLQHVIDTGRGLEPEQIIVVVGHKAEQVYAALEGQNIHFVEQLEQLGTGHALKQCLDDITGDFRLAPAANCRTLVVHIQKNGWTLWIKGVFPTPINSV